jgi:hypothetical protein
MIIDQRELKTHQYYFDFLTDLEKARFKVFFDKEKMITAPEYTFSQFLTQNCCDFHQFISRGFVWKTDKQEYWETISKRKVV